MRALFPDATAFVHRTEAGGPNSLTALRARLVEARRRGYATEDGEVTLGFSSVAAAVTDHAGHPVAGVAVTFASDEVDVAQREQLAEEVTRTAKDLTRRVSGR